MAQRPRSLRRPPSRSAAGAAALLALWALCLPSAGIAQAPLTEDTPSLGMSEYCIKSPQITCVNSACHPQQATEAEVKPPAFIMAEVCLRNPDKSCTSSDCHPKEQLGRWISHPPYLDNRCKRCHIAPDSKLAPYLTIWPDAICLSCHRDIPWDYTDTELSHPPGKPHCTFCHNPHQSRIRNLLRRETILEECSQCHDDFLRSAKAKPFFHKHFDQRMECGFCHYAHRRGLGKHVRENTMESCLTCHDLPIQFRGRVLENVAKRLREAPFTHGAIKKGTCPNCHTPHGSDQPALLKPGYPSGSYRTYDAEQFALCMQCHPKGLIEDPEGKGSTQFRNGPKNLHYSHIVEIGRGRACHLCHEPHASNRPHLLRDELKFALWNSPFDYKPLPDGGECLAPCHRKREYRREIPALNLDSFPSRAPQPEAEPAPASDDETSSPSQPAPR